MFQVRSGEKGKLRQLEFYCVNNTLTIMLVRFWFIARYEHGNKRRSDAIRGKFGRDLWMICLSYFRTSFFFFFFSFFSLLFHCNGESFLKTCSLIDLTTSILGKIWKRWMEIKFFSWKGILWFFFFFHLFWNEFVNMILFIFGIVYTIFFIFNCLNYSEL